MKLISLSEKLLKYMVTEYKKTGKEVFTFEKIQNELPEIEEHFLNKSLFKLKSDGLIKIFEADNIAYTSTLLPQAIIHVEENTLLKKGYTAIKEIKSLLV
ncbi:hypothetical protein DFO70_1113 [Cytobacillus firmus]|uniref:YjcQ protein n=2 Tax=Cytobacillus TaxID=2675230 RepID=A0A366JR89_CYTFI|nr:MULTISPECIES: lactate permease [Cytobacillus]RBP89356.1 hypothetical protein DFO70_1113 [Cytobacillus firmus]TDX47417.1 hypothetical protein DFO72_101514 [Cytobacillus oceanisediminis]